MDRAQRIEKAADAYLTNGCGLEDHIYERGDPFNEVAKRELLSQASAEAKALVSIILNAPGEVMRIFGREKNKRMRELHILSILVRAGKDYTEAQIIMDETRRLVRAFL